MARRSSKAVVILLLALCSGLALGQTPAPSCPASCDVNKLQPVNQTGSSSTDVVGAVKTTLDIMLGAIASWAGPEVGGVAGSVETMMDTGFSLWTAWDSVLNPQQSIKNSLHNDMVKLQDYLVCEVDSIVTGAVSQLEHNAMMTELGKFDQLVGNTISQLNTYCGALNCLNVTSMPPSQRNAAVNDNCVTAYPSKDCAGVTTWNPLAPTPCTYVDPSGSGSISGVCDADGKCYSGSMSRSGAQGMYKGLLSAFNSPDVNNLAGLDQFPQDNAEAVVVAAKMSLLQVNLYQQLILMGSTAGENDTMKSFANVAAATIQNRYSYLTNITRIRDLVDTYSTISNGTLSNLWTKNPNMGYPTGGNSIGDLVDDNNGRTLHASCGLRGDSQYVNNMPCYIFDANYGNYQLAYGCEASKQMPAYQQTENFCYWSTHSEGLQASPAPCAVDTLPFGLANPAQGDFTGVCTDFNNGVGRCTIDNHFPGDWIVAHNNWLWGNYTAAKEALAQSILANVTTTLKDVKTIIGQLTQLGTIGMPAGSLNAFLESYPLQKCDALNPINTAAAAGSTASLKGDGAVPLPAGAVLTPAAPATAAAMVAPKAAAGGNRKMLL